MIGRNKLQKKEGAKQTPVKLATLVANALVAAGATSKKIKHQGYPNNVVNAVKRVEDVIKFQAVVRRHLTGGHKLMKSLVDTKSRSPSMPNSNSYNAVGLTRYAVANPFTAPRAIKNVAYPGHQKIGFGRKGYSVIEFNKGASPPDKKMMVKAYRQAEELIRNNRKRKRSTGKNQTAYEEYINRLKSSLSSSNSNN